MFDPALLVLPLAALAIALSPMWAAVAAAIVVLAVVLVWKLAKLAVKVAVIAGAVLLLFFVARQAGWL